MNATELKIGDRVVTNDTAPLGQRGVSGTVHRIDGDQVEIRIPKTRISVNGLATLDGYRFWTYTADQLDAR